MVVCTAETRVLDVRTDKSGTRALELLNAVGVALSCLSFFRRVEKPV